MVFLLIRLTLFLVIFQKCAGDLFAQSEECYDTSGQELKCPSNIIYYFECCANECCLRTQIVPAVIIALIASVMTIFCLISCFAYCCCGE